MKRLAILLVISSVFLFGSPIAGVAKSTLSAKIAVDLRLNSIDSSDYLVDSSAHIASGMVLNRTYLASNAIPLKLEDGLKDNSPSKIKYEQIKVVPASGSYQGGCMDNDYCVEISGANFGSGWDISNVTICGVDVCHILMQSTDFVTVYPSSGTPGTGDIVITSASKGKITIANGFTYLVPVPKNQAKNIQYSNVGATSIDISWNRGSGESCVLFMKEANAGSSAPLDHTTYKSSNVFGEGTQIDSTGWYCVYNGHESSVSVSGLVPGKDYIAQVFEYNGQAGFETFLNSQTTDNPMVNETIASTNGNTVDPFSTNISVVNRQGLK